ncbi:MAG: hypothetical protein SFW65_08305 [Alphaproteobacteria bacterium]|nr:hypothetical protein [Alphaproteobacteria bacterium]
MLNTITPHKPLYRIDEDRTETNPDGSTKSPADIAFYPDRNNPEFRSIQTQMREIYGGAQVYEFDGKGKSMGLVTAPGINMRGALSDIMQIYRDENRTDMVDAISEALKRFNTAPSLRP